MGQDNDDKHNDDKLKDLSQRLKKARGEESPSASQQAEDQKAGIAFGMRAGIEFAVAILVGFAIGYFLDGFFGTRPFLMILFGFLGLGAGVSNIYRLFNKMDMSVGYKPNDKSSDKSSNNKTKKP